MIGYNLLIDISGSKEPVDDLKTATKALAIVIVISKTTLIKTIFHTYKPHGLSISCIIKESHITYHTWPEYGYVSIDLFSCGEQLDTEKELLICKRLKNLFDADNVSVNRFSRIVRK